MIMCSMADQVQDDFEFERDPIELAGQFEGDIILPSHDNTHRVRKQTKKRKKNLKQRGPVWQSANVCMRFSD